jgi:hypothetical protein
MSTKNLARTVIEGGRTSFSRFARRHSHAVERSRSHQIERQLCTSLAPETAYFPARAPVWRDFDDKLSPARRWLRSQVGRPWDKVRADLLARVDTRTTAGRHIVFDHLLLEVEPSRSRFSRNTTFWISPQGILRYEPYNRQGYRELQRARRLPEPEGLLRAWLGERRVLARGARLYWLTPTPNGGFRQHLALSADDALRFRALPPWFRTLFEGAPRALGGRA